MKFDLSKAGSRMFVNDRGPRTDWMQSAEVMQITDSHIYLSAKMLETMKANPKEEAYFTLFFQKDGLYLANVTNQHELVHRDSLLKMSKPIAYTKTNPYKGARSARNKTIIKTYKENSGHDYGMWQFHADEIMEEATFPVRKLHWIKAEHMAHQEMNQSHGSESVHMEGQSAL